MSEKWSRAAFATVAIAYALTLAWLALSLPDRVPTHFDAAGEADGWSSKPAALAMWAGLGVFILGGGALLARYATAGDGTMLNMPQASKDYWLAPERRAQFRRRLEADLLVLSTWTGLLLIAMMLVTLSAAEQRDVPGWWFWAGLGGYLLGTAVWTVWLLRRYRPPAD